MAGSTPPGNLPNAGVSSNEEASELGLIDTTQAQSTVHISSDGANPEKPSTITASEGDHTQDHTEPIRPDTSGSLRSVQLADEDQEILERTRVKHSPHGNPRLNKGPSFVSMPTRETAQNLSSGFSWRKPKVPQFDLHGTRKPPANGEGKALTALEDGQAQKQGPSSRCPIES